MVNRYLINRNYALLWLGKFVSQVGDKFYAIALAWWVLQKTNSPVIMGFLMAAALLPGLLIGPVAGALIDRRARKPFIVIADLVRAVFVMAATGCAFLNILEVWHVFVVAAVISLGSAFFDPAVQAVIPRIVPGEQLPRANGLSQTIGGISTVIGPLLGAVVVSAWGVGTVFLANGLSYLVSACCGGLMRIPGQDNPSSGPRETWRDIRDGLRFLGGQKRMLLVIVSIGVAHFFIGSLMVSLPFLARVLQGSGVRNLGYLEATLGLGTILGALFVTLRRQGGLRDAYLFLLLGTIGGCYFLIGILKSLAVGSIIPYLGLILWVGIATANAAILWQSLLQLHTPDALAGRIFSISTMIGNLSLPLAFGLFGILLGSASIITLMIFSGVCLAGISLALLCGYQYFPKS